MEAHPPSSTPPTGGEAPAAEASQPKAKAKRGHGRAPFPEHLPRETVELDVDEADRGCSCGKQMQRIGEEVTERGHIVPTRMVVKRYVRPKYACPDGHGVLTADLPDGVIDGGKYRPSGTTSGRPNRTALPVRPSLRRGGIAPRGRGSK